MFFIEKSIGQLHNTIRKHVRELNKKLTTIECNKILSSLGFPNNWFVVNKLPQ